MVELAVVIPTRNRADLAEMAVESVLRADLGNVSVVVSDNSTEPAERERLESFCERHAGRVHYVRPPEPLAMDAHWEWALGVTRREVEPTHLAYLTDRLVFAAGALEELVALVEREPDRVLSYQFDTVDDGGTPVELVQAQWTGRLLELDARRLIELSSRGDFGNYLPRLLNSIAPMRTVDAVERRFGNVFRSVSPDYCFAYRCLAVCDTINYLDRSCVIEHGTARSAGITWMRGRPNEDARRFQRELTGRRFGATPEPELETNANAIWQEYFTARAQTGDGRFPPVDRDAYLAAHAVTIDRIEEPELRARMQELLRSHGWTRGHSVRHALELSLAMAGYFARHPTAIARTLKRQLWDRPPGTPLAFLLPKVGLNPRIRDLRFESTTEAIAYAGAHPRPRRPYAWHVHRLERAGAIVSRSGYAASSPGARPAGIRASS